MNTPKHIAFIMDGNGRWAQSQGLPRSAGHKAGFEKIPKVLEICHDLGIQVVSSFAWSTENWGRPKAEVEFILKSMDEQLMKFVKELHKKHVRFVHSGSREKLNSSTLSILDRAAALTRENGPEVFNLAFNYSGRAELIHVAQTILSERIPQSSVCESSVEKHLWTSGLPDVDLLVRTGFEKRISNFMLWQCAHACVSFPDCYWPEINRAHISHAVQLYTNNLANIQRIQGG